jgi:aspartate aminotransferase
MIAEICLEKNIYIISDEIYEKLIYDGLKHLSIASLSSEIKDRTITVNGVSKAYAMTGWRIGYAAGPQKIISAMNKIQGQITSNPTSIAQMAAVEALTGSQKDVELMRNEFQKRRDYIVKELNSIQYISCTMPGGAFYAFPNIARLFGIRFGNKMIKDSLDFCSFLLEEAQVAVVPGKAFGTDDFVRFSFATSMQNIKDGIEKIKKAIGKLV